MRRCPKCDTEMEQITHEGVEVDRCTKCRGLWFDNLEHERLAAIGGSEAIDRGAGRAEEAGRSGRVKCPVCHTQLIDMVVLGQPHIRYESCNVCGGVFFDAGEFADYKQRDLSDVFKRLFGRGKR